MFRTVAGVTPISQPIHTHAVDRKDLQMENPDPQTLGVLTITAGVSFAMVWLGIRTSMIQLRRPQKCPACGRLRQRGVCGCS